MRIVRRQVMTGALKLVELVLMVGSFGVATFSVLGKVGPVSLTQFLEMRIKLQNFLVFFILLCLWHLIFRMLGLYDSKRLTSRWAEVVDVIKATSLGSLVLLLSSYLIGFRMVTPTFVSAFWAFSTCLAVACRVALRTWLRGLRTHGRDSRNMLIVGSNRRAIEFAKTIRSSLNWVIGSSVSQMKNGMEPTNYDRTAGPSYAILRMSANSCDTALSMRSLSPFHCVRFMTMHPKSRPCASSRALSSGCCLICST